MKITGGWRLSKLTFNIFLENCAGEEKAKLLKVEFIFMLRVSMSYL